MDQAATQTGQVVSKMIDKPTDAWMAALPILFIVMVLGVLFFCYKLWHKSAEDSTDREVRLTSIIDTSIKEHSQMIGKQTETLNNVNTSLLSMREGLCDVKNRVEEIECHIGIGGGT